ncbi:hypothetical protein ACLMAL_35120 [Nocardia sp. CWNU-33]|uniref:hypothetical protein n=1 Tax=Nocardia sp. CWNU-33 TaxID=3392117 RepID=UPI00398EA356
MSIYSRADGDIEVRYDAAQVHERYGALPASVWVSLDSQYSNSKLNLSIEDVRVLAERLPEILMAHDAAEHARAEQAAAEKSAAESRAA